MQKPKNIKDVAKNPTKGRVKLAYAMQYLKHYVYVLRVDNDIFMSLVSEKPIFHFYLEMLPEDGKKRLTSTQVAQTLQILLAGAHTTIEQKLGIKQPEREAGQAAEVIKVAEQAFGKHGKMNKEDVN